MSQHPYNEPLIKLGPLPLRFDVVTRGERNVPVWSAKDMQEYASKTASRALSRQLRSLLDARRCLAYDPAESK